MISLLCFTFLSRPQRLSVWIMSVQGPEHWDTFRQVLLFICKTQSSVKQCSVSTSCVTAANNQQPTLCCETEKFFSGEHLVYYNTCSRQINRVCTKDIILFMILYGRIHLCHSYKWEQETMEPFYQNVYFPLIQKGTQTCLLENCVPTVKLKREERCSFHSSTCHQSGNNCLASVQRFPKGQN